MSPVLSLRASVLRHELAHAAAVRALDMNAPRRLLVSVSQGGEVTAFVEWKAPPGMPESRFVAARMLIALTGPYYSARRADGHPCGEAMDFATAASCAYALAKLKTGHSRGLVIAATARQLLEDGRTAAKRLVRELWSSGLVEKAAARVEERYPFGKIDLSSAAVAALFPSFAK